jgi:ABC-type dipeptide/oligopeptide/nickel transport system ATPase component
MSCRAGSARGSGIARAIALKPEFILADEIVSGLDVSSQAQVLNVLADLVKELGLTLAFISHDLSVIRRLCDRVMVLQPGQYRRVRRCRQLVRCAAGGLYARELLDAIPLARSAAGRLVGPARSETSMQTHRNGAIRKRRSRGPGRPNVRPDRQWAREDGSGYMLYHSIGQYPGKARGHGCGA